MTDDNLTLQAQAETETEMPMAFVEERPTYYYPNDQKPLGTRNNSVRRFAKGKRMETGKTRTWRIGTCPTHNQRSTDYIGVDLHGWLFHCEVKDHMPHYFHNKPAE